MSMLDQLMQKPWAIDQSKIDDLYVGAGYPGVRKKIALRVFLAVVAVFFTLLLTAYGGRMVYEDWRPAPQMGLLWANTFLLILSSVAMQWAHYSVRREKIDAMRVGLLVGGAFTLVFLFGQFLAWRQLAMMVSFDVTNPAIGFFYMITGLHGLHLLGGLVAWGRTVLKVWGEFEVATVRQSVELCTTYWHFLLLVWLVLFGLLFSGNNLDLLLKLCGIR